MELFKHSRICGNSTRNPPTTPGGMTVRPVTTGITLNMFVALSKLQATIFHIPSLQLMRMRQCAPCVGAIGLGNTLRDYTLEVLLISKRTQKGREECHVLRDIDCSGRTTVMRTLEIQ